MIQDSLQPESSSATFINKVQWKTILAIYFLLLFQGLLLCFVAFTILRGDGDNDFIFLLCLTAIQFFNMVFIFLQQIIFIVQPHTSYVKVTPEGIENKVWLDRHIFVRWSDLEQLEKYFYHDVLYVKTCQVLGPSQFNRRFVELLSHLMPLIFLSSYKG